MAIDDSGLRDLVTQGALAGVLGMTGRLLALAVSPNRPSGWNLLWEVPLAVGMGVIGIGVADWAKLTGFTHYAAVIVISYIGPRILDIVLAKYVEQKTPTLKPPSESDKK